jgi:hypothetical protein
MDIGAEAANAARFEAAWAAKKQRTAQNASFIANESLISPFRVFDLLWNSEGLLLSVEPLKTASAGAGLKPAATFFANIARNIPTCGCGLAALHSRL